MHQTVNSIKFHFCKVFHTVNSLMHRYIEHEGRFFALNYEITIFEQYVFDVKVLQTEFCAVSILKFCKPIIIALIKIHVLTIFDKLEQPQYFGFFEILQVCSLDKD